MTLRWWLGDPASGCWYDRGDERIALGVEGELDYALGADLLATLDDLVAKTCGPFSICIDLTGVSFIDRAGLKAARDALDRLSVSGLEVTDCRLSPCVERLIEHLKALGATEVADRFALVSAAQRATS